MTARQLRRIRTKVLGLTQTELAVEMGYADFATTISRKETELRAITTQDEIIIGQLKRDAERKKARAQRRR